MSIRRRLACALIAAQLCACATTPPGISEAQRARMGSVGVATLPVAARGDLNVGTRGTGAGAVEGAIAGAAAFVSQVGPCSDIGCIVVPIFAVAGLVVGGITGATQAVPDDSASAIEARLRKVLAEVEQQAKLQSAVVDAAARFGVERVAELSLPTPSAGGARTTPVDTILEVALVSVGLVGRGGSDPDLALRAAAVARLSDARTAKVLYDGRAFTYATGPRKFSEWNADGARLLRQDLERAYRSLGNSIVDEIFLVVRIN